MENLDTTKITMAMLDLAKKMLSGKEIKKVRYRVTLEVPEEIAQVLEELSEQLGTSVQDTLGKFASEGLDIKLRAGIEGLKEKFTPAVKDVPPIVNDFMEQLKGSGIDLGGIMDQMKHLRSMAGDLQNLQKVVEDAVPGETTNTRRSQEPDSTTEDSKDSE